MTETHTSVQPNYAVATGEHIEEWMEDNGMNAAELARRLDVSPKHVSLLLRGKVALSAEIALGLERVTGVPARWWLGLEALYQADKARLAAEADLAVQYPAALAYPLKYLRQLGYIKASARDHGGVVAGLLRFFGVADMQAIRPTWERGMVVYRKAAAAAPASEHLMTWLRVGELKAPVSDLPAFDRSALEQLLPKLRALSLADPSTYVDKATEMLAAVGVAICLVPEVPGLGVHGATRWVRGHPLIQLSLRGKTDDQLWFTLFHELGHVLLHPPDGLYLTDGDSKTEAEADRFASDTLVPPALAHLLPKSRNLQAVRDFAQQIGVSPGVVLGRVQREMNDFAWGQGLKVHFRFEFSG